MYRSRVQGWCLFVLLASSCVLSTLAYPNPHAAAATAAAVSVNGGAAHVSQAQRNGFIPLTPAAVAAVSRDLHETNRKFAEKPNALKKVALDDIDDDIQTNQIQDNSFSWTNMLATMLQMFFNGGGAGLSPTKSDAIDTDASFQPSPWANVLSVGLKIITAILGGGANNDGIDKVDNGGGSPMQNVLAAVLSAVIGGNDPEKVNTMAKQAGEFINIVVNLLDALKTSFSHRSIAARSSGKKDSVSDATVAGISLLKGYVRTYRNSSDKCMQRYLCEANDECTSDIGGSSIFCQLGTYAASFMLERTTGSPFEHFYDAGRKGRSGVDCRQIYLECNEV